MSILRGVFEGDINSDCIFTGFVLGPLHAVIQEHFMGSLPTPSEPLYLKLVKGIYTYVYVIYIYTHTIYIYIYIYTRFA